MEVDNIELVWSELEKEVSDHDRHDTVVKRLFPESLADLFLGYRKDTDRRMLLVAIGSSDAVSGLKLPRTRGIDVSLQSYPDFMPNTVLLSVCLLLPNFKRMFSVMAADIVLELRDIDRDTDLVTKLINGILKWQQLLEKLVAEGLSPEAQRGLYGELHFLRKTALSQIPPSEAVDSWTGPTGSNQDFQYTGCAVEVKTTTSKRHEVIHVANEKQLDDSVVSPLYLVHVRLTELVSNAKTLPALVEQVRLDLEDDQTALSNFDSKLLNVGYHDSQAELYNGVGYKVQAANVYLVEGDFPRIVDSDLRNGVGDVKYSIVVAECNHYQADENTLLRDIGGDTDVS